MAFTSMLWPTDGTGHGPSGGYSDADWRRLLRTILIDDGGTEGIFANYAQEFEVTAGTGEVTVGTGAAAIVGIVGHNDTPYDIAISTPTLGPTAHRVVLRANYAAQTVTPFLLSAADGVNVVPALVQVADTTWDIDVAHVSVTTGGVITVTDQRHFLHYNTRVSSAMIDASAVETAALDDLAVVTAKINDLAVTTGKIADEAVTAAKIANRTRTLFVPVMFGYEDVSLTPIDINSNGPTGIPMDTTVAADGAATFMCPSDFVSGLTMAAVVYAFASGDVRFRQDAYYGAAGESFDLHTSGGSGFTEAMTAATIKETTAIPLTSIAIGDYVSCLGIRQATDGADVNTDDIILMGFKIFYTADS